MWGLCTCSHHKSDHPWIGRGPYGSASGYAGCSHCTLCDKPSREHEFSTHFYTPCPCSEYQETA